MKILLDTNIILDYALQREEFWETAEKVFLLTESEKNIEFVSSSAVTDIFYVLRKYYGDSFKAQEKLSDIRKLVRILEVSDANIDYALALRWKDFEDAVQYAVAVDNDLDVIVTRNVIDFERNDIPVLTPAELLNMFTEEYL